jgi:cytochrome b561
MRKVSRYHPLLVTLHWLLAALIIAALALGALVMAKIPNTDPMKLEALRSHIAGGSLIVSLMLVRLLVRVRSAHPDTASTGHPLLDKVAWASHRLFYVLVIGMAASGLSLAWQAGLFDIVFGGRGSLPADLWVYPFRSLHYVISRLLMALIALHIIGALFHTFVLKDGLLRRMAFGRRRLEQAPSENGQSAAEEIMLQR